eukprot:GHVH01012876.1.p1 GENE.GHVH01012876.1~~GHVH01012876.1.p1  ORF type:complete len:440 (+),score=69.94 GHVH01012876.1:107-1321(+)
MSVDIWDLNEVASPSDFDHSMASIIEDLLVIPLSFQQEVSVKIPDGMERSAWMNQLGELRHYGVCIVAEDRMATEADTLKAMSDIMSQDTLLTQVHPSMTFRSKPVERYRSNHDEAMVLRIIVNIRPSLTDPSNRIWSQLMKNNYLHPDFHPENERCPMWTSPVIADPSLSDDDRTKMYAENGIHRRGIMYALALITIIPSYPASPPEISLHFSSLPSNDKCLLSQWQSSFKEVIDGNRGYPGLIGEFIRVVQEKIESYETCRDDIAVSSSSHGISPKSDVPPLYATSSITKSVLQEQGSIHLGSSSEFLAVNGSGSEAVLCPDDESLWTDIANSESFHFMHLDAQSIPPTTRLIHFESAIRVKPTFPRDGYRRILASTTDASDSSDDIDYDASTSCPIHIVCL